MKTNSTKPPNTKNHAHHCSRGSSGIDDVQLRVNAIQVNNSSICEKPLPILSAQLRINGITLAAAKKNDNIKNAAVIKKITSPS